MENQLFEDYKILIKIRLIIPALINMLKEVRYQMSTIGRKINAGHP